MTFTEVVSWEFDLHREEARQWRVKVEWTNKENGKVFEKEGDWWAGIETTVNSLRAQLRRTIAEEEENYSQAGL